MKKQLLLSWGFICSISPALAKDFPVAVANLVDATLNGALINDLAGELTSNQFPIISGLGGDDGGSLTGLTSLGTSTLLEPQGFIANLAALGVPLAGEYSPLLGVLLDNPETTLDALLGGSASILSPGIAAFPEVPLLSAPLGEL